MDRTSGELVMVTPAATQAVCAALDVSARNLQSAYTTMQGKVGALKATWGPSTTGTAFFEAFAKFGQDIDALCQRITQTSKTVDDNTAQGLALDGKLGNMFT
jgi:uncharacterized protein YukE